LLNIHAKYFGGNENLKCKEISLPQITKSISQSNEADANQVLSLLLLYALFHEGNEADSNSSPSLLSCYIALVRGNQGA